MVEKRGLGREQVHTAAWGRESYPHPLVSCMMPLIAVLAVVSVMLFGFSLWQKTLPGNTTVPPVVGISREQAIEELRRAGLQAEVAKNRQSSETVPRGAVISISPAVGRSVKMGRAVHLLISSGSAYVKVPDVVDASIGEARELLAEADLRVEDEKSVNDEKVPVDRVMKITPKSGTKVLRGSTVKLVISKGPVYTDEEIGDEPVLRSDTLTIDIPEDEKGPADLRIDVTDDEGKRTVYQESHEPGDTVTYGVQGYGDVKAEVFYGNKLLMTRQL